MAQIDDLALQAATKIGRPDLAPIMKALAEQESGGSTSSDVVGAPTYSGGRARGPWQVMPATARSLGFKGTDADLQKPEVSAEYAARLLDSNFKRYNGNIPDVLAAYYQGDNRKDASGRYSGKPLAGTGPDAQTYVDQTQKRLGANMAQVAAPDPTLGQQSAAPDAVDVANQGGQADIQKFLDFLKSQPSQPGVEELFKSMLSNINSTPPPPMRVAPQAPGMAQRFLSSLAGGLATNVTRNPQFMEAAQGAQADVQGKHDAVVNQNNLTQGLFQQNQEARRNKLQDVLFERHLNDLLEAGDTEKALKLMLTKGSLETRQKNAQEQNKATLDETARKAKAKDILDQITARGEEARKTLEDRANAAASQYNIPKSGAIELEKALDSSRGRYNAYIAQQSPMMGGPGLTPDDLARIGQRQFEEEQAITDHILKKYGVTPGVVQTKPATPGANAGTNTIPSGNPMARSIRANAGAPTESQ